MIGVGRTPSGLARGDGLAVVAATSRTEARGHDHGLMRGVGRDDAWNVKEQASHARVAAVLEGRVRASRAVEGMNRPG